VPDTIEGQPTPEASAPAAPVVEQGAPASQAPFDPVAFKAELESSFNQRIAGIQSGYQQQLNERDEQIRQLKTASLSEEEREQLAEQEATAYFEELEVRAAMADVIKDYGVDVANDLQKLFGAESMKDQAAFLASLRNPQAAPTQEPAASVPPVDANNPPPASNSAGSLIDGQPMTDELRKQILQSFEGQSLAQAMGRRY
jgi:hypothetical protein